MRRDRPIVWRVAKWGGAVVTVLLVAAWIGTRSWCVVLEGPGRTYVGVNNGGLGIGRAAPGPHWIEAPGLYVYRARGGPYWWFHARTDWIGTAVAVPLWAPTTCMLLVTGAAWRRDILARRSARAGHCPKCGYDRRGIDGATPCPECGKDVNAGATADAMRSSGGAP